MFIDPYYPRTNAVVGDTSGQLRWISRGGSWNESDFDRTRDGAYGALQWRKDDVSSSLTYFRSKYEMNTTQHSFFVSGDPNKLELDPDATFDANGALLTGTLRAPTDVAPDNPAVSGLGFGTVARNAGRTADTRDVSWNVTWKASPQWTFMSDLQQIKALSDGFDYLVGTGGWMPKQQVDLSTSPPRFYFDAADRAFLADPSNYYWGSAQEHRDHATATQKAWRGDAKFTFDHPVLNDVRFGVRLTERKAVTDSTHDSEWAQITAPWAVGNSWQPLAQLAWMSDPRFAGNNSVHAFNNFFNGQVPMPAAVVVPNTSLLNLAGLTQLHDYTRLACRTPARRGCCGTPLATATPRGATSRTSAPRRCTASFASASKTGPIRWTATWACASCRPTPRPSATRCSRHPAVCRPACPSSRHSPSCRASRTATRTRCRA
jgi:hypothetical protein